VAANVAFERDAIGSLQGRGIKLFQSGAERYFLLDSMNMMLENFANKKKRGEPRIDISVRYGFHGKQIKEKFVFYLNDWFDSAVVRPLDVMVLEELTKKIEGLSKNLEKIAQTASKLSSVADGTGLRLSQRTLRSFKGARQLFDPYEFDWLGYKIVLDVSNEDALALHQVFGTIQPEQMRQQNYRRLGRNLRAKFERVFKLPF
jgi:hypothetical protein